jgi:hypothetical protein
MKSYKNLITSIQPKVVEEETHSELARQAASKYRTALARGDSVGASQANAERFRHKKAAAAAKQKSHTPGIDEEVQLDEVAPVDLDKYFAGVESKVVEKKPAKKEPEQTITGSQIKFFNNKIKEEVEVNEAKDTVVRDKNGKLISFKYEGDWKKADPKKNPEGKVHNLAGQALKKAQNLNKEEVELEESYAKVETHKYSWGTMKTAHHGHDFSVPMHPEHHKAIHALKDNQEHKFKDETGRHWTAKRQGDDVHLHSANNGPKTKIKHSDLKEEVDLEEATKYVVHYHNEKGEHVNSSKAFDDKAKAKAHADKGNGIDKVGGKYSVHKIDAEGRTVKEEVEIEEQAPVAPVPDRKYIKGTPEWKAHKEKSKPRTGHPTHKEDFSIDDDGNVIVENKLSYGQFMDQLLEYTPGPGGVTRVQGRSYGAQYHDPEGDDDADDKPAKKVEQPKRGRGRPVGSKSGAGKISGTSKLYK